MHKRPAVFTRQRGACRAAATGFVARWTFALLEPGLGLRHRRMVRDKATVTHERDRSVYRPNTKQQQAISMS